jgi:hypothetical protein
MVSSERQPTFDELVDKLLDEAFQEVRARAQKKGLGIPQMAADPSEGPKLAERTDPQRSH